MTECRVAILDDRGKILGDQTVSIQEYLKKGRWNGHCLRCGGRLIGHPAGIDGAAHFEHYAGTATGPCASHP
jgi:hypothetical protein